MLFFSDKFDQFWAVNRRLMEPISSEDGFKHFPLRMYDGEGRLMLQKLAKTVNSEKQKVTLGEYLNVAFPGKDIEQSTL